MTITNQDTRERLEEELLSLINDAEALDSSRQWLRMNHLWFEPIHRRKCTELITSYLNYVTNWSDDKVILYLDGVASLYGVLPLMGEVGSSLGCKLAVWRELGQIILTEPWLLPSRVPKGLSCVVFQDVVGRGATLLKAIDDLSRVNWSVTHYVCLVKTKEGRETWQSSLSTFRKSKVCSPEFEFHSLIDARKHLRDG
jgi:hypothetical protein